MIGKERRYYKEVDSTNTRAKEWAKRGAVEGSLVIADKQVSGKGRNGRTWVSQEGVGIWMSLILRPQLSPQKIPQLTLIVGLAVCKSIKEMTGLEAGIKWPNDIVIKGKKVCGILCEMQVAENEVKSVVVGVGINVNTPSFPDTLSHASSLYLLSGVKQDRDALIENFCTHFEKNYTLYKQEKNLSFLLKEYEDNCITLNNKVKIIDNQQTYEAYANHISESGHLVVTLGNGEQKEVFAGEVSVRGLYDYV